VRTVLSEISGPKCEEVMHNEEFHNLYPLLNIIRMIKLKAG
jgi:hypothetical protein